MKSQVCRLTGDVFRTSLACVNLRTPSLETNFRLWDSETKTSIFRYKISNRRIWPWTLNSKSITGFRELTQNWSGPIRLFLSAMIRKNVSKIKYRSLSSTWEGMAWNCSKKMTPSDRSTSMWERCSARSKGRKPPTHSSGRKTMDLGETSTRCEVERNRCYSLKTNTTMRGKWG